MEVRVMRKAETILEVLQKRGEHKLPVERLYRQLYNTELYLRAYAKIYSNKGATTPGTTEETADRMSLRKIDRIVGKLRNERYQWKPVRRIQIPKRDGRKRPLGLPSWSDKLLQEVIRSLLEAYYEPLFSKASHGFRPSKGCHTALNEIQKCWKGTKWFIEGDIKGCFDNIDHDTLIDILAEKIHDNRLLELIRRLLKAGYMENWRYGRTLSGTPQGGILSPLLSNIYLDKLDKFVKGTLLPEYNRGKARRMNKEYNRLKKRARREKRVEVRHEIELRLREIPSGDPNDPNYRRLRYIRYADDFILGFIGPKSEAEIIKERIRTFLEKELKLELSESKTLITHARNNSARFLGYKIKTMYNNTKLNKRGYRAINGDIWLRIPYEVIDTKCRELMKKRKILGRPYLLMESVYHIVSQYQAEYRGLVQYYKLAHNSRKLSKLKWAMEYSLTGTLANKLRISRPVVKQRYEATYKHPNGKTYKTLEVRVEREGKNDLVARWGGIPLNRNAKAVIADKPGMIWVCRGGELLQRLLANKCEICGSEDNIEVHHVRALKDLNKKGRTKPRWWETIMAARRRKTLVVCEQCHLKGIHSRKDPRTLKNSTAGEPDELKGSRPVRRGVVGKVPMR
jgi:group II intron reverse transcriptase/maturase